MSFFKTKKAKKEEIYDFTGLTLPAHIAIIPDGNRRWAKEKNLPVRLGHKEGAEAFRKIVKYSGKLGIKYITFYAFSTENWKRDESEVKALMDLLLRFLVNSDEELGEDKSKISIRVIGDRSKLSEELQKGIADIENETKDNTDIIVSIAINYGGRAEIADCVTKIAREIENGNIKPDEISEELINNNLYTKDIPDPDLLIRTSGEMRISNFLLWQLAYTEFYFADVYWPDFDSEQLDKALWAYTKRQRRYGGT